MHKSYIMDAWVWYLLSALQNKLIWIQRERKYIRNLIRPIHAQVKAITLNYQHKNRLSSRSTRHAYASKSTIKWKVSVPESIRCSVSMSSSSGMPTTTGYGVGMNEPMTTNKRWCMTRSCRRRWVRSQANHWKVRELGWVRLHKVARVGWLRGIGL